MFSPEELKAMEEVGTHMAEITEFVPLEAVDPVYFDKAYYLAPDKGGAKPTRCSRARCASRSAARSAAGPPRQAIHRDDPPAEDGLVMQQLLYAGEVRAMKDLEFRRRSEAGRAQARADADRAAGNDTFDPAQYTDEVPDAIEAAVQKKGRRPGDHARRAAGARWRPGHRSHGGAPRESREEGSAARQAGGAVAGASRPSAQSRRKSSRPPHASARKKRRERNHPEGWLCNRTASATSRRCYAFRAARSAR
jgi:hypothetical protein